MTTHLKRLYYRNSVQGKERKVYLPIQMYRAALECTKRYLLAYLYV